MITMALAQMDCVVGDIAGNAARIRVLAQQAYAEHHAHLIAFPELALTGYPPEDLLLRPIFISEARAALMALASAIPEIDMLVGLPWTEEGCLYNAVAWIKQGKISAIYCKQLLPNYGVFDERRYFTPGQAAVVQRVDGLPIGVTICEDLWEAGPVAACVHAGARFVINVNASPYHRHKEEERLAVARLRVHETHVGIAYVNMVGGQDELVFDGQSFVVDEAGRLCSRAAAFADSLLVFSVDKEGVVCGGVMSPLLPWEALVYAALKRGLQDYVRKNHMHRVLLGLSGGIDSALTLALCHDALGAAAVSAVMMPSRYTAAMSIEDAQQQAAILQVSLTISPIDRLFQAFIEALDPHWQGPGLSLATENLQARIRGTLLMSLANAHHALVVVTSNKSEIAVGYTTLYGDMAGGYAPLKDVLKTDVYALARYRNSVSAVIPERVLTRPPSAELREGQQDTDSLPPYDVLDTVLRGYVEANRSPEDLIAAGVTPDVVAQVMGLIHGAEHKRRQAPIGTRVTARAFGRDWRYPITATYGRAKA